MKPRYKVAIIAGQLVVGGAEQQLYYWLSNLDREIFQPVVLTLHPGHGDYWEAKIRSLGFPLTDIEHRWNRLVRLIDIIRVLKPYQPDLIHGWHAFAGAYACLAARFLGVYSLAGIRGSYGTFKSERILDLIMHHAADALVLNSQSAADQIKDIGNLKNKRIFVVQNAVEDNSIDRRSAREYISNLYGLSQECLWIGSVARLDPLKKYDLLLKILSLLRQDTEGFHAIIFGDGPEKQRLEKIACELRIADKVTFTGEVPEACKWLRALDIYCFPSVDEGLPNAVMEAAAAGLTVVAWNEPFMQELLINEKTGLLITPGDLAGFKEAILSLCRSREKRIALGQESRKRMSAIYSVDKYVRTLTEAYMKILNPNTSKSDIS